MSYQQAERDVAYLTGIRIPAKTQQRLVHRRMFPLPRAVEPVKEVCVDGGKIRLRTPLGEACEWRDVALRLRQTKVWVLTIKIISNWLSG